MKRDVPHFRIGLLLTEAGIIAPPQLDDAIRQGEEQGQPFLRVLVGDGTLKQHELQAVIRAQSLIWSGLLDVDRAIRALSIVHSDDVSIDEGLRSVGWVRPADTNAETIASSVQLKTRPMPGSNGTICQYCGAPLENSSICSFCTGENQKNSINMNIAPAWERQASDGSRLIATTPARDPLLMAFFSGCCIPGLGQLLLGQTAKGMVLVFLFVVLGIISSGIAGLIMLPIAALDAYLLADKLREGKTVGLWEFF